MEKAYTYAWHINQFIAAKREAERFLNSLNDPFFLRRPGKKTWSIAECYSHQINFGEIYFQTIQKGLNSNHELTEATDPDQEFKPRWFWKLAELFFEPPYKMKVKTFEPFEPDTLSGLTRKDILSDFTDLQGRFIAQIEKAEQENINLNKIKVPNPILPYLKMTLSECYSLAGAHQRRHQWQAQQILKMLEYS